MTVRRLGPGDVADWKTIRRAALEDVPHAFGRTLASFEAQSDADHAARLAATATFGFYADGGIAGSATWRRMELETEAHRGRVHSVYLRPGERGSGGADALMSALLADASGTVLQLELDVAAGNARAIAFYRRHGFEVTGRMPRALRHGESYIDEVLMVRRLDP